MSRQTERRKFLEGMALSAGAVAMLQSGFGSTPVLAQENMQAGVVHQFSQGGITFHTYVSPAQAVHVTSHIVEFPDQLLMVDATMLPDTAREVASLIAGTGKPVGKAVLSHEHPDHWGAAAVFDGIRFSTLPAIRANVAKEGDPWVPPENVLQGPDLEPGITEMSGVPVEFRHFQNTEAFDLIATVFPEQKVAIVQDLVYNGLYAAPGIDRANWIATLESLRDAPAFDTLLVGHGLPTSRGDLDHMIRYIKVMDAAINDSGTPEDAIAQLKEAYPGQGGEFLLSLISDYWQK